MEGIHLWEVSTYGRCVTNRRYPLGGFSTNVLDVLGVQ